jgi:hypothetical protein
LFAIECEHLWEVMGHEKEVGIPLESRLKQKIRKNDQGERRELESHRPDPLLPPLIRLEEE